jgi:hypothetical protein
MAVFVSSPFERAKLFAEPVESGLGTTAVRALLAFKKDRHRSTSSLLAM